MLLIFSVICDKNIKLRFLILIFIKGVFFSNFIPIFVMFFNIEGQYLTGINLL